MEKINIQVIVVLRRDDAAAKAAGEKR